MRKLKEVKCLALSEGKCPGWHSVKYYSQCFWGPSLTFLPTVQYFLFNPACSNFCLLNSESVKCQIKLVDLLEPINLVDVT